MTYVNSTSVMVVGILFPALGLLCVVLRFMARWKTGNPIGLDDWSCIPALITTAALAGVLINGATTDTLQPHLAGTGETQADKNKDYQEQEKVEKYAYAAFVIINVALGFIKLSLLLFYRRIFVGKWFTIINWSMVGLVVAWAIAFTVAFILSCGKEVSSNWGDLKVLRQSCGGSYAAILANSISDFIIDIIILAIPLIKVWKLQMSTSRKVEISVIFMLGSFAIVACGYRMAVQANIVYFPEKPDAKFTHTSFDETFGVLSVSVFWTYLEIGVGLICCSIPSIRPLFSWRPENSKKPTPASSRSISAASSTFMSEHSAEKPRRHWPTRMYSDISPDSEGVQAYTEPPEAAERRESTVSFASISNMWNRIRVRKDIDVTEERSSSAMSSQ